MNLERFIAFGIFDAVIEHAERVVEIAPQTKAINNRCVLMNNRCVPIITY